MLVAIIVAVLAAVVVIVAVAAALALRARRETPSVGRAKGVSELSTVGVGSSPFERRSKAQAAREGDVTVSSSEPGAASKKPSDELGRRFAGLAAAAVAIFGALSAKLWSMQIAGSEAYAQAAEENLYTTVKTPAPRGCIYDTNGEALVVNRPSQTVVADPEVADNRDVVRRLSTVLGLPANVVLQRINDAAAGAQSLRVVGEDVRLRDVAFIAEHADAFPGITVEERSQREYPYGALAAHVLGYTGRMATARVSGEPGCRPRRARHRRRRQRRGGSHLRRVLVRRARREPGHGGRQRPAHLGHERHQGHQGQRPLPHHRRRAQYVADAALAKLIAPSGGVIGTGKGSKGAVVALDVTDGSVLVMASFPTFDPTNFTGCLLPRNSWIGTTTEEAYAPLNNNVVSGQFMAASTFKAFTSLAGLEYGFATESSSWNCTGKWDGFGTGDVQRCWKHDGHGTLDLHGGIVNSCDTVFYEIGKAFYDHGPAGTGEISETALQDYLGQFGFGEKTDIDLGGETVGVIPTPAWKAERWQNVPSEATFRGGDYTNMIIGQGDVLVTPLQVACAYAGVATGRIMRPHLLKEVRNSEGETVVTYEPVVERTPEVTEAHLAYVRDALHGMVQESHSVAPLFEELGIDAAGKSGTGEKQDQNDTAWFVAYAPYNDPKYVVACVVEQGGGGSDTAAPVVAEVMGALMDCAAGTSSVKPERISGSPGESVAIANDSGGRED